MEVQCPQCMYTYRIVYPGVSPLLFLYEHANHAISFCSPMILAGVTASSLYWISFTYGVTTLSAALGRERSIEFFSDPSSSLAVVCLPLLPWATLGLKVIRLEVQVLRIWHRLVMPVILGFLKFFPFTRSLDLCPTNYRPTPVAIFPHVSRCIVGTFFLPIISCLLGWAFSNFLQNTSNFKRTLLVRERSGGTEGGRESGEGGRGEEERRMLASRRGVRSREGEWNTKCFIVTVLDIAGLHLFCVLLGRSKLPAGQLLSEDMP